MVARIFLWVRILICFTLHINLFFQITFPNNYKYFVVKFKSKYKVPPLLECEFPISDVSEIKTWKANYEKLNKIFFRKNTVRKSIKESVLYKVSHYFCSSVLLPRGIWIYTNSWDLIFIPGKIPLRSFYETFETKSL